jgi:DNA-binding CsgD family transcriptional regulator
VKPKTSTSGRGCASIFTQGLISEETVGQAKHPEGAKAWPGARWDFSKLVGEPVADLPESRFLQRVERTLAADSIEKVWSLHVERMAEFGFDRLLYGFTRFKRSIADLDPDDIMILSNLSQNYLDGFFGRGHFRHLPSSRWALENDGACSWRWLDVLAEIGEMSEDERRAIAFNRSMGIDAGYSISFPANSSRAKGAIGLCARSGLDQDAVDAIWQAHGREIMVLNQITHLRIINLPFDVKRQALTPRQREVLEWVGDGKTSQEIATILGVNPATVDKHLRLARETLDAETTAQAVLKASFNNQIYRIER